jgi:hypothetical protein
VTLAERERERRGVEERESQSSAGENEKGARASGRNLVANDKRT